MIYTITFNPAIDYVMKADSFRTGSINRSREEQIYFGGKGINVSTVLNELGMKSTALGFVAGFTGTALEEGLKKTGIITDFIHLEKGITRINVKIRSGEETDINAAGTEIDEDNQNRLISKLDSLTRDDFVVLSGSIPKGVPTDIYETISQKLNHRDVPFIVDATGTLLSGVLKYRPFLVKPNKNELEEIFDVKINKPEQIEEYANKLREKGAKNVLVSLGKNGAVLIAETGEIFKTEAVGGESKNTVGAGDSMVAGFLYGFLCGNGYEYALKLGNCAGSATAISDGLATKEVIDRLMKG